jgi:hypothetical protein
MGQKGCLYFLYFYYFSIERRKAGTYEMPAFLLSLFIFTPGGYDRNRWWWKLTDFFIYPQLNPIEYLFVFDQRRPF